MIIELSIENFRSIRDRQLFSMVSDGSTSCHPDSVYHPEDMKFGILKSAGIYGANAAGKTNILTALRALQWIVSESGTLKEDQEIVCHEPNLLDSATKSAPTTLEMEFIPENGLRHIYKISYTDSRILKESLDYYPSRTPANLFFRDESHDWKTIKLGGHYKGGTRRIPFFANNSFLSVAGNNAASPDHIRSIYRYIRNILILVPGMTSIRLSMYERPGVLSKTAKLLELFDTGVCEIRREELPEEDVSVADVTKSKKKKARTIYKFVHKDKNGASVEFPRHMESLGTIKLFEQLPWIALALELGTVVCIDELDSSLHSHIAETLIGIFNSPKINKNNAQLIFTTHNIRLMSNDIFRRDQIWLVEKKENYTTLYSVSEFDSSHIKHSSPFDKWYQESRLGAVPRLNVEELEEAFSNWLEIFADTNTSKEEAMDA